MLFSLTVPTLLDGWDLYEVSVDRLLPPRIANSSGELSIR